jgi:membrane protease YdiL (CAAX protease family)
MWKGAPLPQISAPRKPYQEQGGIRVNAQDSKRSIRNLVIFVLLVNAVGWLGRWVDSLAGSTSSQEGPGILIWLIAPLGVSLLLRVFAGDGWKDLGIRPAVKGNVLWYAISILVYPVCTVFILVVGSALGAISLSDFSVGSLVQAIALAIIPGFFTAIEEFGWRGYLAPKVYRFGLNAFVAHAVVGVIWGAWHIPYFSVFWSHSMQNLGLFLPCFFLGAIAHSIVYGEIRMQTDSVWPAFLMHAVSNAVNNTLLLQGFVKMASGKELLVSLGIEGFLGIIFFALVGVGIHLVRRNRATT